MIVAETKTQALNRVYHPDNVSPLLNKYFAYKNSKSMAERIIAKNLQKQLKKKGLNIK